MNTVETIPDYLARMVRKDLSKGYDALPGSRTTVEVAEYFGLSYYRARKSLESLLERGIVDCYAGRPLLWVIADPDDDDGDGEPIPANDNEVLTEGSSSRML